MSNNKKILTWLENSDLTEDQKDEIRKHFKKVEDNDEINDFQINKLKDNLKINTRFLNKAVEDLEKTVNLLKESNKQLGNFVSIASHDLKSPIRSIVSFSELLSKMLDGKLDEKEKSYFGFIQRSAKSMSELINDLLLFTKINAEELSIKADDMSKLLNQVLTNLSYEIESNNVTIESNFEPVFINCDPVKFKQVLQNLISNSIKFSSGDGNKPHVILDFKEEDRLWCFSVKDNGIGIDKEFRDIAFQEFKKFNGDSYKGSGMGLAIVKKIVNKHDGTIWVEPTNEKGTTITFTISKNIALTDGFVIEEPIRKLS